MGLYFLPFPSSFIPLLRMTSQKETLYFSIFLAYSGQFHCKIKRDDVFILHINFFFRSFSFGLLLSSIIFIYEYLVMYQSKLKCSDRTIIFREVEVTVHPNHHPGIAIIHFLNPKNLSSSSSVVWVSRRKSFPRHYFLSTAYPWIRSMHRYLQVSPCS